MINDSQLFWVCLLLLFPVTFAVEPLPPRNLAKQTNTDCTGLIAFSASGSGAVLPTGIVTYKHGLVNLSSSWDKELGVFTVACAGLYQFSFSAYTENNVRMILQKRSFNAKQWVPIISTSNGGGSVTILVEVNSGDQVAVFISKMPYTLQTNLEHLADVTSFNAYRIAKT
ncbi:uncharacterized protein LOC126908480 [Daktulosphaira vitifoliae]|uniref:uncharacterized protein LOC126908480 n=1 Tax=Daktulosphaira vitifoliae TaxID=58002 RepID=UPI0021AAE604|nr:uncharacterized protein LOC126908480 [Daktulosphaira vitifoliae]